MSCKKSSEIHKKCVSESRNITVHFIEDLADTEILTGAPTVTGSVDLTISSIAINSVEIDDDGLTIGIGKAVQFSVSGGIVPADKSKIDYEIEITVSTDSVPSQILKGIIILRVFPG